MIDARYFGPRSSALENATVGRFVCELIWQKPEAVRDYCTMGVFDDGELIAGVLYHNWFPEHGAIELTGASIRKRWLSRSVVNSMAELPFTTLNCQVCILRVSEKNDNMIHIARSFGFLEYYIPRLRGRNEGEFVFTLTDDQWKCSKYRRAV